MSLGNILIRADVSVAIGTGHVMRCLALAQAWRDAGGEAAFAMAESLPSINDRLRSEGIPLLQLNHPRGSRDDARETVELARSNQANWVVLDGYCFSAEYQRQVKDAGIRLLVVDDNGESSRYFADLVLNQNVHSKEAMYEKRENYTRLLLGSRYVLLRREFWSLQERAKEIPESGRKVLITMGGSDPNNVTAKVVSTLRLVEIKGLQARVLVGGGNLYTASLRDHALRDGAEIGIVTNPHSVTDLMLWADVAVSAAGSTCWEMCFLGVPAILIAVAENQMPGGRELARREIAVLLGATSEITPERIAGELQRVLCSKQQRENMSQRGRELVDGRGCERVLTAMLSAELNLRHAGKSDCRLLWEWANDPSVRAASFQTAMISWDEHEAWFADKLDNGLIYIAEDQQGNPVGQFRIDRLPNGEAKVDVSVAPEKRGCGIAAALIQKAVQAAFRETEFLRLHAYVKPENRASLRAFEKAGFTVSERAGSVVHFSSERSRQHRGQAQG
jgi:UDP-2,4-diacetamido-2,4,6-trideoxy-beta-L-altropyranose hydrolase